MAKKSKRRANKAKAGGDFGECDHGCCTQAPNKVCAKFMHSFCAQLQKEHSKRNPNRVFGRTLSDQPELIDEHASAKAMFAVCDAFPQAWKDGNNHKWLKSQLLAHGTDAFLCDFASQGLPAARDWAVAHLLLSLVRMMFQIQLKKRTS